MKKFNLDIPIIDINGDPISDKDGITLMVKTTIANMIMHAQSANPIRMAEIARNIYNSDKQVEIEDHDFKSINNIIKEAKASNLVKEQIYKALGINE